MKKNLYPAVSMAFILIIWQIVVIVWKIPAFILPGPAAVFSALAADAQVLLSHSVTTLNEAVLGLVIASVLSFITALAMDYWKFLEMSFYPLLVISQMLPIMVLGRAITYPMVWFRYASKSDPCCLDKLFSDRSFFFGYIEESIKRANHLFENDGGRYREDLSNI